MIIENKIQQIIDNALIEESAKRAENHVPSGLLSASMLYQPTKFQVMKTIGVPQKALEPYTLGKFKRGNDVEDWYVSHLEKAGLLVEAQKEVRYRGVIGYVDAIVNPETLSFKQCKIHEVKSVTNAKLKQLAKTDIDYHYRLQATLYALALGEMYYSIDIISAEDYRVNNYIFDIKDTQKDVDEIISKYNGAMAVWEKEKRLPLFEVHPKVTWTKNFMYAPFEEKYCNMSDEEIVKTVTK